MAYPTSLDSFTANVDNVDVIYASDVNELQTAITAIEAKIGVDSSAVTTSHDYKLSTVTGSDKALPRDAAATTTNKILSTGTAITLGSDAEGDTYYRNSSGVLARLARGTDNYIYKMNGNVPNWEAEITTVDASTTVKGIVEAATSAEVTAGTATGGTGAVLVVTPDALAASTPVFNGSALTSTVQGFIDATATNSSAVTSTVAETTVATISIAGGTLSTNKVIKVRVNFQTSWTADGTAVTYRLKYGGTTLVSAQVDPSGTPTTTMNLTLDGVIQGAGTTSSQEGHAFYVQSGETSGATPVAGVIDSATAAIDSTSAQNLLITVQHGTSNATVSTVMRNHVVQKIV